MRFGLVGTGPWAEPAHGVVELLSEAQGQLDRQVSAGGPMPVAQPGDRAPSSAPPWREVEIELTARGVARRAVRRGRGVGRLHLWQRGAAAAGLLGRWGPVAPALRGAARRRVGLGVGGERRRPRAARSRGHGRLRRRGAGEPGVRAFEHGFWRMSPSGRQLVHADGTPALMVADTAWALPWRATPEQVEVYARDRQAKGFNAVLLMTVQPDMRAVGPRDRTRGRGLRRGLRGPAGRPPARS